MKTMTKPGIIALFTAALLFSSGGTCVSRAQNAVVLNPNVEQEPARTLDRRGQIAPTGPIALPQGLDKYVLTTGTTVQMSVFGAPEMSFPLTVDANSDLTIPLVGTLHVAGETVTQVQQQMQDLLVSKQMFNAPVVVSLQVTGYSTLYVNVSGQVQLPGNVPTLVPKSLADVIAMAGGETVAAGGDVLIMHGDTTKEVPYGPSVDPKLALTTMVFPGDSVFVKRAGVVYVLGAVNRPGGYLMADNGTMTVPEAIAYAQGTTQLAAKSTAYLVRRNGDGNAVTQIEVPLKKVDEGRADTVPLHTGDVLYVRTSGIKDFLFTAGGIIGAVASSVVYAAYR